MKIGLALKSTKSLLQQFQQDRFIWRSGKAKDIIVELSRRGELPLFRDEIITSIAKSGELHDLWLFEKFLPLTLNERKSGSTVALRYRNLPIFYKLLDFSDEFDDGFVCELMNAISRAYNYTEILEVVQEIDISRLRLVDVKFFSNPLWMRSPISSAIDQADEAKAGMNIDFIIWTQENNYFENSYLINSESVNVKSVFYLDYRNYTYPEIPTYVSKFEIFLDFLKDPSVSVGIKRKYSRSFVSLLDIIEDTSEKTEVFDFSVCRQVLIDKVNSAVLTF